MFFFLKKLSLLRGPIFVNFSGAHPLVPVLQETSAEVNDVLVVRRPPGYSLQGHPQSELGLVGMVPARP